MSDSLAAGTLFSGPLYKEVLHRITKGLADGEWKPGEAIPSESQLAARFNVSIGTIRKAIDELVADKILVRQPGRGTFVSTHTQNRYMFHFFHILRDDGLKDFPATHLVRFGRGRASVKVADLLEIRAGAATYEVTNYLTLAGEPVVVDRIVMPEALFPGLTQESFAARDSTIYGFYQSRYGINVIRTVERLKATLATEEVAELLNTAVGTPLLQVTRIAYTYNNVPVEHRQSLVLTDNYHYLSDLKKS